MKYSYANGVRAHANKYSFGRGFKKAIDYDRLSLIIAGALVVSLLAYGYAIRQSLQFPSPIAANQANANLGDSDSNQTGKNTGSGSTSTSTGEADTPPSDTPTGGNREAATVSSTNQTGGGAIQPAAMAASSSEPVNAGNSQPSGGTNQPAIGGRGGGTTGPETTSPPVSEEKPNECICETPTRVLNDAQGSVQSLAAPLSRSHYPPCSLGRQSAIPSDKLFRTLNISFRQSVNRIYLPLTLPIAGT
jgi:cytoskeletal protein RodZ